MEKEFLTLYNLQDTTERQQTEAPSLLLNDAYIFIAVA